MPEILGETKVTVKIYGDCNIQLLKNNNIRSKYLDIIENNGFVKMTR